MGRFDGLWAGLSGAFSAGGSALENHLTRRQQRELEEQRLLDRAKEREADRIELQIREAGAGSRNISNNATRERVAKLNNDADMALARDEFEREDQTRKAAVEATLEAVLANPDVPKEIKSQIQSGRYRDLAPDKIAGLLLTPYARINAREDQQDHSRLLKFIGDNLGDVNRAQTPARRAAFAARMLETYGTDFLEAMTPEDLAEAAEAGVGPSDYSSAFVRRQKKAMAGGKKPTGSAASTRGQRPRWADDSETPSTPAPPAPPAKSPAPGKKPRSTGKKSWEAYLQ